MHIKLQSISQPLAFFCSSLLTSAHIRKGTLNVYQTVGKLWSPEGLLQLHHATHRGLTSQHTSSPVITLSPSSYMQ